jgi:hypothetical protein
MQKLSEPEHGLEPDPPPTPAARRGLPPRAAALVVAIFAALLIAVAAGAFDDRGQSSPVGDAARPSTDTRTAEPDELRAVLEELLQRRDKAFDTSNREMLAAVYVEDGAAYKRAKRALEGLISDGVHDASAYKTTDVIVKSVSETNAQVERVGIVYPCFRDQDGKDVTRASGVIQEHVLYVLQLQGADWRIANASLLDEEILVRERSSCHRV